MSMFFSYKLNELLNSPLATAWHPHERILAVSSIDGSVSCFSDEGVRLNQMDVMGPSPCMAMAFHPMKVMLACGFKDGTVSLWNDAVRTTTVGKEVHPGQITLTTWSPEGRRLITGDDVRCLVTL